MSAMSYVFLCGGDCVEDVNRNECHLRESPEVRIPTSHTIGRAIKELSHEDMECKSSPGNVFRFNTSPRLNDLLMKLNMKMGLFKSGLGHINTVHGGFPLPHCSAKDKGKGQYT